LLIVPRNELGYEEGREGEGEGRRPVEEVSCPGKMGEERVTSKMHTFFRLYQNPNDTHLSIQKSTI
jgi:hypothetical protein